MFALRSVRKPNHGRAAALADAAAPRDMDAMLQINRALALLLAGFAAGPAYARITPTPPPSGIVIHLWGPPSVSSTTPPAAQATMPEGNARSSPLNHETDTAVPAIGLPPASTTANATAPENPANDPSWGDIAHQMFVTGDPAQEGRAALPKGRAGSY
jgi:hypothetical protein